jgi:class 3 adenylate cyclase/tetratricopeptide (TPR) repeat protein
VTTASGGGPARRGRAERKLVSILFADLSGYTALAESLDPEEVYGFLLPTMAELQAIVEGYGGTVPQVQGDGFMAVFGVPVIHEDDAERAVRAALAVRDRVRALNGERTGLLLPEVHAGVNSGEVMVGPSNEAHGFTIVGDTVNTASRLADLASSGRVLVDEQTRNATAAVVSYGSCRLRRAKGKAEPLATYEALGAAARQAVAPARSFLDREDTFALLGRELEQLEITRRARVVVLVGEPGVGKTRLALQLADSLQPGRFFMGRCAPFGERRPLAALGEAVAGAIGLEPGMSRATAEATIDRVARRIGRGQRQGALAADLRALLTIDAGGPARSDRDAARAARLVFEDLAKNGTVALVLDDLHWADASLAGFLADAHRNPWPSSVLLLGLSREEVPDVPSVPLTGLDVDTMRALAGLLLGSDAPHAVDDPILRANGNPLFLEEMIGMLVETGVVRPIDGAWQLVDPTGLRAVPSTIRLVIAARLDALPHDEKQVLQDASVCGTVTWEALLDVVSDVRNPRRALRGLVARDLVRKRPRSSIVGTAEYELKHTLIRDVAYDALPRAERAAKHLQIGEWMRSQGPHSQGAPLAAVAHHYERAWELSRSKTGPPPSEAVARRATEYLTQWAERTFAGQARAAEPLFRRALRVADASDDAADPRVVARATAGLAEALIELGRHREASEQAARARRLAERLGDDRLAVRALLALGRSESDAGNMRRARTLLLDAQRRSEASGDLRSQGWARHRLSETWGRDDYAREIDDLRGAHRLFVRGRDRFGRTVAAQDLAYVLSVVGGKEFQRWYEEARRLVEDEGDLRARAGLLRSWGYFCFYAGRPTEAIGAMAEARPLAAEAGDRYTEADALLIGALATASAGAPAVAESLASEAMTIGRQLGSVRVPALARLASARASLRQGRPDLAARSQRLARDAVHRHKIRVMQSDLAVSEGQLVLDRGAWDRVEPVVKALGVSQRSEPPGLWRPLPKLFLGRALLGQARARDAIAPLEDAARSSRDAGADGTLALAEACLTQARLLAGVRAVRSSAAVVPTQEPEVAAVVAETTGVAALLGGHPREAAVALESAVERWQGLGSTVWLARALALRAEALRAAGDRVRAAASIGRVGAVLDEVGTPSRFRASLQRPLDRPA